MFQMFGFGGVKCPRCAHKNGAESDYCTKCGLSQGAPRNDAVLHDNRWLPAADELAVFFGIRELSGLFNQTLRVPAATRAYILQADVVTEVPQDDYEPGKFFSRLRHLRRSASAEILITRTEPLAVDFAFTDLYSAEQLKVSASFSVSIKVDDVAAFARHFMTSPGTVTVLQLHELLAAPVRQLAAEFIGARSIREMAGNAVLRPQLDERLQAVLQTRVAQFGLAVVRATTLALRHDKYDESLERTGTLWLVADERQAQIEHVKQIDQLYDEQEWQNIWREERNTRVASRRAEIRQDSSVESAELAQREAERVQVIRARAVELYGRIIESNTREQAFERGAGATLSELEHELANKGAQHAGEAARWGHVQALATIKMQTELEVAQQGAREENALAAQRFAHRLHQQQIENQIAQALAIEDEAYRRAQLTRLRQSQAETAQRESQMQTEQHQARWQSESLENAAGRREAQRVQEWQDQMQLAHQRDLLRADSVKDSARQAQVTEIDEKIGVMQRAGAQAGALAQHEKLLRTIEAESIHARTLQQAAKQVQLDQLAMEEQRQTLLQQEQEGAWQRELERLSHEREVSYARWKGEYDILLAQQAHSADLARIELERIGIIGNLSDTGKVAMAAVPNAEALARLLKTQVHAGMDAAQIEALAVVVGAENSIAPADATRMAHERVQEERAHMEAQADKVRRHELDLINLQNAAHNHALSAQMQLGVGVARASAPVHDHPAPAIRVCSNGHPGRPGHLDDKFCAACGAPLQP